MSHYKFTTNATFEASFGAFLEATLHVEFDLLAADPDVGINDEDIDITDVQMVIEGCWLPFNGSYKDDDLRFHCWGHLKGQLERAESDHVDSWIQERKDTRIYLGTK